MLRLVVGLLAPSTGTVEVLGHDVTASTPQTLSRVGFLAQDHPLYKRFTVAEMLHFGRACNRRFDQKLAERRLAKLGIPLDRRTGTLSGVQQFCGAACPRSVSRSGRSSPPGCRWRCWPVPCTPPRSPPWRPSPSTARMARQGTKPRPPSLTG
ncbi:hypothetical protein [Actinoplanes sp. TFC3]|uniref:ATP-binding cassette domain-containing protein n=1 Tax=Actinoplanes sp. TFC3 TaxID=1710355 RepID=UPI000AA44C97|nr:hypothetical protein [Actinoplanes sp. TFC3]